MPEYRIYALKYAGPFVRSQAMLVWMKNWESTDKINYYIWYLQGSADGVVVDTGVAPAVAEERQLPGYISPAKALGRIGVQADAVRHVVLTHLHWDHACGVSLFPKATFYVQEDEYHFWLNDPIALRPPFQYLSHQSYKDYLADLEGTDRLVLLRGDQEILPGVECLLAPGHTPGLQVVAAQTARGTAIIASDAGHVFRNFDEDWPSALFTDLRAVMRTYDKLRARTDRSLIFPGHDMLLLERYPSVAEDVTRLA